LIETTKFHSIDPQAYSIEILAKLVDGCRAYKLDELLP
jgi:IS66 C-terminal element